MDRKIVMLLIGIVAIGMFALPSTLAMYTGQHTFINGSNVNCTKCHGGSDVIYGELALSDAHSAFQCDQCHGFGLGIENNNTNDGSMGHAATTQVTCLGCHLNATYSAGSDDGNGVNITAELANGAHSGYYAGTLDKDQVCLGCHAKTGVTGKITNGSAIATLTNLSNYSY